MKLNECRLLSARPAVVVARTYDTPCMSTRQSAESAFRACCGWSQPRRTLALCLRSVLTSCAISARNWPNSMQLSRPQQKYWRSWSRIKELALLLNLYERDPQQTFPALAKAAQDIVRWNAAIHTFHPAVVYALQDYNLLTRRYDPAPPSHWAASASVSQLSEQQLQHMKALLQVVNPRLQRVEQERQRLLQELTGLDAIAAELAEQDSIECGPLVQAMSLQDTQQGVSRSGSGTSNATCGRAVSLAPAAAAGAGFNHRQPAGGREDSRSTVDGSGSSSGSGRVATMADRTKLMQRREHVMQQLAHNCTQWRITTQMRGQWLISNCTPLQLAKAMMTAFPYMPHGAPILDTPTVQKGIAGLGQQPAADSSSAQQAQLDDD